MFVKTESDHFEYLIKILQWERHIITSSLIIIFITFKQLQILQYGLCVYDLPKATA